MLYMTLLILTQQINKYIHVTNFLFELLYPNILYIYQIKKKMCYGELFVNFNGTFFFTTRNNLIILKFTLHNQINKVFLKSL